MKPKAIQRGVTSRGNRGGSGNLDGLSQLRESNAQNSSRPMRRSRGRSRQSDPAHRRIVILWSVMLSVVTLGLFVVAVSLWLRPHLAAKQSERPAVLGNFGSQARVVAKFESPSPEQSLEMVKRAMAIRSPEQVEALFRTGEADRAEVMQFFQSSEERDGLVDHLQWFTSLDLNGMPTEAVLVTYKSKTRPVQRIAFLTPDVQGNWKLDFESFARTARPTWNQLFEGASSQAVVRVIVRKDVYYNGVFGDDKVWTCFRLVSLDREELIRGYCAVGSPEAAALDGLFVDGRAVARATMEIFRTEHAEPFQFQISRVLASDWLLPDRDATLD